MVYDVRRQAISSHGIDLDPPEYSGLGRTEEHLTGHSSLNMISILGTNNHIKLSVPDSNTSFGIMSFKILFSADISK